MTWNAMIQFDNILQISWCLMGLSKLTPSRPSEISEKNVRTFMIQSHENPGSPLGSTAN